MEKLPKPQAPVKISLSPSHSNALLARMKGVEEDCREIARWLEGVRGIYEESVDEPDESTRRKVRESLAEVRALLAAVQADLGLGKKKLQTRKVIRAHLAHLWETAHESKSGNLKGYGAVPDELRDYIDTRMDQLLSVLDNLAASLSPPPRSHPDG
jgi:hypothetical protein